MNKKEYREYVSMLNYSELKNLYMENEDRFFKDKLSIKREAEELANLDIYDDNYDRKAKDIITSLSGLKSDLKWYNDFLPIIKKELEKKEAEKITSEEYNNYIDKNKVNIEILLNSIEEKRQEFYNNPKVVVSYNPYKEIEISKEEIDDIIDELAKETIHIVKDRIGDIEKVIDISYNNNRGFDGIIEGAKATIYINTILAGGWNIQKLHYRTLANIRPKALRGTNE